MVAAVAVVAGCAHREGPTFAGADLYAQVQVLQDKGRATVPASPHPIEVGIDQILVSVDGGSQTYEVRPIIENCRGGDPEFDRECTLALLRGQRFRAANKTSTRGPAPTATNDDAKASSRAQAVLVTLLIGAPLTYGVASCHFGGCKVLFGVPLTLDACLLALAALRSD
jgi:hypothetical protein